MYGGWARWVYGVVQRGCCIYGVLYDVPCVIYERVWYGSLFV